MTEGKRERGALLTIGNFDGVHLGHRALISLMKSKAEADGVRTVAMTFHPHPVTVLTGREIPALQTLEERVADLREAGIEEVSVYRFSAELAAMTPREFVERVLVEVFGVAGVVVGPDFRFGARRAGDAWTLAELGKEFGFSVDQVSIPLEVMGEVVSSTRLRRLLGAGDMRTYAAVRGGPYGITGTVVHGAGLGKGLGFPTANVVPPSELLLPPAGVYAALANLGDGERRVAAVSLGSRPTFDNGPTWLEAHILDFDGDIYGQTIRVDLHEMVRSELRFDSVEELKSVMRRDVEQIRNLQLP